MTCLTIGNPGNPGNPWEEKLPKMTEKSSPKKSTKKKPAQGWRFFFTGFATTLFFFGQFHLSTIHSPTESKWVFPKIGAPQNGWFIIENPIENGWFGGTTIFGNIQLSHYPCLYNHPVGWVLCLRSSGNFVINKRVGKVSRLRWLDEVEGSQDGSLFENPWGWGPLNSSTKKRSIFSNSWVAGLILRANLGFFHLFRWAGFWC